MTGLLWFLAYVRAFLGPIGGCAVIVGNFGALIVACTASFALGYNFAKKGTVMGPSDQSPPATRRRGSPQMVLNTHRFRSPSIYPPTPTGAPGLTPGTEPWKEAMKAAKDLTMKAMKGMKRASPTPGRSGSSTAASTPSMR